MMKAAGDESLTRIEEEVQRFWQLRAPHLTDRHGDPIAPRDGAPYLVSHQPLRAAGEPRVDQIRVLCTTDLLSRYRAMRGDAVQRLTGWACHGLSVEYAAEQSVAAGERAPGMASFNATCRHLAEDGIRGVQALAQRLGVRAMTGETYRTMDPQPIGRVWSVLRRLWEEGRLRTETRVVSVCTRCGTPLSDTEVARHLSAGSMRQGYQAWVRLPWAGEPLTLSGTGQAGTYLLLWTRQPWMLLGMVAVAAHPDAAYVLVEPIPRARPRGPAHPADREAEEPTRLLVAENALGHLEGDYRVIREVQARSLRGSRYRPLFTFPLRGLEQIPADDGLHRVVMSTEWPLGEGTGLQPVTPSFHAGSLATAQAHGLPMPEILDDWGNLDDTITRWRGVAPLEAEPLIIEDLSSRGLLIRARAEACAQPLCPYCQTALLPLARRVWLVDSEMGPWILGRNRAWGTPLPVWNCEACGEQICLAGLDDLARRTGLDVDQIDPHRPGIDRLVFPCERCGEPMRRIAPLVDAAFEEAVLPGLMASRPGPVSVAIGLDSGKPGWLEEVAQVTALLGEPTPWQRALRIGSGEAARPWDAERVVPADALRWASFTQGTPEEAEGRFLRPLWMLATKWLRAPAEAEWEDSQLGSGAVLMERWVLARLHQAIGSISLALDACNPGRAAEEVSRLVSDLCEWYEPFCGAESRCGGADGSFPVLQTLTRLLAPFVPHVAEAIYRRVYSSGSAADSLRFRGPSDGVEAESVHLTRWPVPRQEWADPPILDLMARVRMLAALGGTARTHAGLDPSTRLERAQLARLPGNARTLEELALFTDLLARALNVGELEFTPKAMDRVSWRLRLDREQAASRGVAPEEIETALGSLEPAQALDLATQLWSGLSVRFDAPSRTITLLPGEIQVTAESHRGWTAAAGAGYLVVLSEA